MRSAPPSAAAPGGRTAGRRVGAVRGAGLNPGRYPESDPDASPAPDPDSAPAGPPADPELDLTLHRFGVWRGGVGALAAIGAVALLFWLATREWPWRGVEVGAGAVGLGAIASALASLRQPPVRLRIDGSQAWLGGAPTHAARGVPMPATEASQAVAGTLAVAVDLGRFLLLRFRPIPGAPEPRRGGAWIRLRRGAVGGRVQWIPAQRRGLDDASWHHLRVAVHRPAPRPRAPAAPR